MKELLAISDFVKRQTPDSEFSHFTGSWDELLLLTLQYWQHQKPGYREGVVLVPVPVGVPSRFFSNIVQLKAGDMLEGVVRARQVGEEPRKSTGVVGGQKMPAVSVEIVCYAHHVLAENGEQSSDAEWEIISINASPFAPDVQVPMPVGTLIANHFQFSGGTATGMTAEQFEAALRESATFWKDKAHVLGNPGLYYVAIFTSNNSVRMAIDRLRKPHIMFFGHDAKAASAWAEQMAQHDEIWTVIPCQRPWANLDLESTDPEAC
jgi:hypothetical protein